MARKRNASTNSSDLDRLVPSRVSLLLGEKPTIGLEDSAAFDALYSELVVEFEPRNTTEHIFVKELADVQWDLMRLRGIRRAAIESELPEVVVQRLQDTCRLVDGLEGSGARELLTTMLYDAMHGNLTQRAELEAYAINANVTLRTLQYEAYRNGLETITALDESIARMERRRDQIIRTIEDRRRTLAAMSRSLIEKSRPISDIYASSDAPPE